MSSSRLFLEEGVQYVFAVALNNTTGYIGEKIGEGAFYGSSSEDPSVINAVNDGTADMAILWEGKEDNIRSALETHSIRYMNNRNYNCLNKNGGGSSDGRCLTDEIITTAQNRIDELFSNFGSTSLSKYGIIRKKNENLREIINKKDSDGLISFGGYTKVIDINTLMMMPKGQPRDETVIQYHADNIAERQQNQSIAETLEKVDWPCIVVYPDGTMILWNGNHTVAGTKQGKVLTELTCAIIPYEFFECNESFVYNFATIMNRSKDGKVYMVTSSKQCLPTIRNFYQNNTELYSTGFVEFCVEFVEMYGEDFSEKTIQRALKTFNKEVKDIGNRGTNWVNYGKKNEFLMSNITSLIFDAFGPTSVNSILGGGSFDGEGIRNSINYFSTAPAYVTTWVGIIQYKTAEQYNNRRKLFTSLAQQMMYPLGWKRSKEHAMFGHEPYLTTDGKKLFFIELPPRFDIKNTNNLPIDIVNSILGLESVVDR